MAGYCGYSMSNNAIEAYEEGAKPKSKWSKKDILDELEGCGIEITEIRKLKSDTVKHYFLTYDSWHHTSNWYNETEFYSVDVEFAKGLNDNWWTNIKEWEKNHEQEKNEKNDCVKWYECQYLEWGGTRKHPTATERIGTGYIKGNWFYMGSKKKSINANGFKILREVESDVGKIEEKEIRKSKRKESGIEI